MESVSTADCIKAVLPFFDFLDVVPFLSFEVRSFVISIRGLLGISPNFLFSSSAYLASSLNEISPSNCLSPGLGTSSFTILSSLLVASEDILCTFPSEQAVIATSPAAMPATLMAFPAICLRCSSYSKSLTSCSHLGQVPIHSPL